MFEDSLVESRIGQVSSSKRWTTLISIALQFSVTAAVITLPLLHPEALPFHKNVPKAFLPIPPRPPLPVTHVERASSTSSSPATPTILRPPILPSLLPSRNVATNDPPPLAPIGNGMGMPDALLSGIGIGDGGHGTAVSIAPPRVPAKPLAISSGVSQGMLIAPIRPVYPAIAKAAHVEGTVVVEAIISRTGAIESLHVISGSAMLQTAAIDAIRAARYQPYRLNGEATEVQTTITVNFRIGG